MFKISDKHNVHNGWIQWGYTIQPHHTTKIFEVLLDGVEGMIFILPAITEIPKYAVTRCVSMVDLLKSKAVSCYNTNVKVLMEPTV